MAPGAGFEPARGRINSAVPFQLGYPGITLVGNLGVEPSVLCVPSAADYRLPRSRNSMAGRGRLELPYQASKTRVLPLDDLPSIWGGRRKSNPRGTCAWPHQQCGAFPAWLPRNNFGREPGSRTQCSLRPKRSGFPSSSFPKFILQDLVGPSGLEPESQASETCALSRWAMGRSGTGAGT